MLEYTCVETGCEYPVFKFEVCKRHYATYTKPKPPVRACLIRCCGYRRVEGSDFCPTHQRRVEDGWYLFAPVDAEERSLITCRIEGCNTPVPGGHLCPTHYSRSRSVRKVMKLCAVEFINADAIFERDGWTCKLCGLPTLRDLYGAYHPMMATLDHIIPLSVGGDHAASNVQTAHHACNTFKQNNEDTSEPANQQVEMLQDSKVRELGAS